MTQPEKKEPVLDIKSVPPVESDTKVSPDGEKKEPVFIPSSAEGATATAPETANDNKVEEHKQEHQALAAAEPSAPARGGKVRRAFNIAANVAVGAAATAGAKIAVGTLAASFAVPALATLVVSSIAVGAAATLACHVMQNHALKKEGKEKQKFWSHKNAMVFGTSSGLALIGGALFLGFEDQIRSFFSNTLASVKSVASGIVSPFVDAAPVETIVAAPPVETAVAAAPAATDRLAEIIAANNVSADVKEAFARSASANAAVAAQGTKDLAFYAFNGLDGMPKDQNLAVELFNKAAAAGNVQAKVDLAYIQFHGLGGVAADKTAALAAVQELGTAKAEMFAKAWAPLVKGAPAAITVPAT